MLELVVVACLATGPCRDFQLPYDPREVPLMLCVTAGQVEIARWQETRPGRRVLRWRCGYVPAGRADA